MKTMMRLLGKLNKRVLGVILAAALLSLGVVSAVKAETVSGYNGQAYYNEDIVIHDYVFENIEKIYGTEAKNAYVNAVLTGDYTAFRTMIGVWKPVCEIPGVNVKHDGTNLVNCEVGNAQSYESMAFYICGKYGTVSDLFAYAAQCGYDLNDGKQINDFGLAVQLWKTIPYPTQKKAPASQPAAKVAPAASNSKIEALKTFKGNNANFNAYYYYTNYSDLQSVFGADGNALLKHYNEFGVKEGRVANKLIK